MPSPLTPDDVESDLVESVCKRLHHPRSSWTRRLLEAPAQYDLDVDLVLLDQLFDIFIKAFDNTDKVYNACTCPDSNRVGSSCVLFVIKSFILSGGELMLCQILASSTVPGALKLAALRLAMLLAAMPRRHDILCINNASHVNTDVSEYLKALEFSTSLSQTTAMEQFEVEEEIMQYYLDFLCRSKFVDNAIIHELFCLLLGKLEVSELGVAVMASVVVNPSVVWNILTLSSRCSPRVELKTLTRIVLLVTSTPQNSVIIRQRTKWYPHLFVLYEDLMYRVSVGIDSERESSGYLGFESKQQDYSIFEEEEEMDINQLMNIASGELNQQYEAEAFRSEVSIIVSFIASIIEHEQDSEKACNEIVGILDCNYIVGLEVKSDLIRVMVFGVFNLLKNTSTLTGLLSPTSAKLPLWANCVACMDYVIGFILTGSFVTMTRVIQEDLDINLNFCTLGEQILIPDRIVCDAVKKFLSAKLYMIEEHELLKKGQRRLFSILSDIENIFVGLESIFLTIERSDGLYQQDGVEFRNSVIQICESIRDFYGASYKLTLKLVENFLYFAYESEFQKANLQFDYGKPSKCKPSHQRVRSLPQQVWSNIALSAPPLARRQSQTEERDLSFEMQRNSIFLVALDKQYTKNARWKRLLFNEPVPFLDEFQDQKQD